MRIVCVYTPEFQASTAAADVCVASGLKHGYRVEKYESVFFKDMSHEHTRLGLKRRYEPSFNAALTETTCPATKMANGTTHYKLYLWCIENNQPLCIVEHDTQFVGKIPNHKKGSVIQISSHQPKQLSQKQDWYECRRAQRMRKYEPDRELCWTDEQGIVPHPLNGTNGTSGYIIDPVAAERMVAYIKESGIAFADRIRIEHIGEGNLYLQKPQSVFCYHDRVKSHEWARRIK